MSTRAVYTFKDKRDVTEIKATEFHVYKHTDGYPQGAAEWIKNAIPFAWKLPRFEASEFSAAFIAGNKKRSLEEYGGGDVYCTKHYDNHGDLEFRYEITFENNDLHVRAFDIDYKESKKTDYKVMVYQEIFFGTLDKFIEFANPKTCPFCKALFTGLGALSRKDNKTEICDSCGTKEAFEDYATALNKKTDYI